MRWSHGVVNSSGELGEGIDIRGAGGLVHAPGLDSYQIVPRGGIRHIDVMEAPDWLVELAASSRSGRPQDTENGPNGGPGVLGKERTLEHWAQRLRADPKQRAEPGGIPAGGPRRADPR